MSKIRYFNNKFSKISSVGVGDSAPPSASLTFDFGDLKLHDLPKSVFSNGLWQNQTLKNQL